MLERCSVKFKEHIPNTQAAYQAGRSTTEHVFSIKILAEKAITSSDYKLHILLLDMSKAFDTVRRGELLKIMRDFLDQDELHMMKILIEDVQLSVRVGKSHSSMFNTNIGIPQGDSLSPILFTLYLANALQPTKDISSNYTVPEHGYSVPKTVPDFTINQQYADDISWITNNKEYKDAIKLETPDILQLKGLHINASKTEDYTIERNGPTDWKTCKYLGSLLDTQKDITRRKTLAFVSYNDLNYIFDSNKISLKTKIRLFKSHLESVFLYNSELWTVTKSIENQINVFQRNLLKKILKINWPDKISNEDLYKKTELTEWSLVVKQRRLSWYGHLMRLPDDTPAKLALAEAEVYARKPKGGQKTTWLNLIKKDISELTITITDERGVRITQKVKPTLVVELAKDRALWRNMVHSACRPSRR